MTDRKNITQPDDWWAAFVRQAQDEGLTLSEWMGECCIANLPKDRQQLLSGRVKRGQPRKSKSADNR